MHGDFIQEMSIGGGGHEYFFRPGISNQVKEMFAHVWFPLERKGEVGKFRRKLINDGVKQLRLYLTSWPGQLPHSGRAFGATEVAAIDGLNTYCRGISPMNYLSGNTGKKITGNNF